MRHTLTGQSSPQFYTVKQTAALLKISRSGLYRLMRLGMVRAVQVGKLKRVPAAELDRIAQSYQR